MFTIAPFPAASLTGSTARVVRTAAIRFKVSDACQSWSEISPNPPGRAGAAPTLLTRMSIWSPAAATRAAGPPGSARSTSTTRTRPAPASSSSSAEDFRAPAVTCTPSAASPRVTASPIPRLAPVTIAVRPFRNRSMMSPLPPVIPAWLSGGVDTFREIPDLLKDRELILERQDLDDLAVPEVPDRRVPDLDGLAGRRHAAIRAGMRSAPDESHGEFVSRDEHVLDA